MLDCGCQRANACGHGRNLTRSMRQPMGLPNLIQVCGMSPRERDGARQRTDLRLSCRERLVTDGTPDDHHAHTFADFARRWWH